MAKRVLIFSLAYEPFMGGAEIAIREITSRIATDDIEFHLITYRFDSALPRVERIGNVTVHRIGFGKKHISIGETFNISMYLGKILYVPLAALRARQLQRTYTFTGYWAMMAYMTFPIVLLRFVGVRVPYVLTLQEGDPFEHVFKRWYIRAVSPLLLRGIRSATKVQAISSFLLAWALNAGFKREGTVIPNGVDTAHFARAFSPGEITEEKNRLHKAQDDIFLVTTSRLVHKNAVDDVIRALPLLPHNVVFLIYGIGPDEQKLRTLARELGVQERARFMGQIAHAEMPRMLAASDIFIRPSRSEGMGNSFIEAMAAGIPVIATQEGGIADFLFDAARNPEKPTTGWAVDTDAPDQIAAAVQNILSTPEKVAEVTKTAQAMVLEKYDWNIIAKDMKNLFDGLDTTR